MKRPPQAKAARRRKSPATPRPKPKAKPTVKQRNAKALATIAKARAKAKAVKSVKSSPPPKASRQGVEDTTWHETFLEALRQAPLITRAARLAGVTRQTAYSHREKYPEFQDAWEAALPEGAEALEDAAYIRAVEGVEDFRLDAKGAITGVRRVYSDSLLIQLLKANLPDKYKDKIDVTGDVKFTPLDEILARRQALKKRDGQ